MKSPAKNDNNGKAVDHARHGACNSIGKALTSNAVTSAVRFASQSSTEAPTGLAGLPPSPPLPPLGWPAFAPSVNLPSSCELPALALAEAVGRPLPPLALAAGLAFDAPAAPRRRLAPPPLSSS